MLRYMNINNDRYILFLDSLLRRAAVSSAWGVCPKQREFQNSGLNQEEKWGPWVLELTG